MLVWAHHMFTVGLPGYLQGFFMISSMIIAVPTGIKIFNWLATTWRGNLHFDTPMLYALGFIGVFTIGGLSGIFVAAYPFDWQAQDTYFVVAHLHYVLFGGSVFAVFAALAYWWPKMFGKMLDERLGKISFWLVLVGMNLTFFPMHMLGLSGMPRRIADYAANAGWNDWNLLATVGGFLIGISILPFLWNVFVSLRNGKIAGDNPWEANTLEWATSSPPPPYNFDRLPEIRSERPLFDARHNLVAHDTNAPRELEEGQKVTGTGPGDRA
jgi:heme/copper-type cytochrome/quinol oxidase subunit 1